MAGVVETVISAPIQFPQMRADLIDAVRSLSDRDLQERYWIRHEFPDERYYEDLTLNMHILYDDTAILPDPSTGMGSLLESDEEVTALKSLAEVLTPVLHRLGEAPDAVYLRDPAWADVIDRAGAALRVLETARQNPN